MVIYEFSNRWEKNYDAEYSAYFVIIGICVVYGVSAKFVSSIDKIECDQHL